MQITTSTVSWKRRSWGVGRESSRSFKRDPVPPGSYKRRAVRAADPMLQRCSLYLKMRYDREARIAVPQYHSKLETPLLRSRD
jgi:hypothetical protein